MIGAPEFVLCAVSLRHEIARLYCPPLVRVERNLAFEECMAFEKAAKLSEIPPGSIKEAQVGGQVIALANVAGTLYAINNTCLHRGGPLGEGQLEGSVVTCPWHGWQFDVATGKAVQNPNAGLSCYAIELRGDEVYVDLAKPA
jgi:nitrite reductase/ring-hydroxylating ferredoxin subunit